MSVYGTCDKLYPLKLAVVSELASRVAEVAAFSISANCKKNFPMSVAPMSR